MPTSAVAVGTLVEILVSVKRPVTNEGLISSVTPFPFDEEIFVVNEFTEIPPLRPPELELIAHAAPLPAALKFPLDWAKTMGENSNAIANAPANFFVFITRPSSNIERSNLKF
jgi:hypothetical protein